MAHTGGRISILIGVFVKSVLEKLKYVTSSGVTMSRTKISILVTIHFRKNALPLSRGSPPTAQSRGIRVRSHRKSDKPPALL